MNDMIEKQKPITIKDNQTGEPLYTLEFDRATIAMAERQDFRINELGDKPLTTAQMLFYYAFQMHHRGKVSKDKTDELFEQFGGISNTELVMALRKLYDAGMTSLSAGEEKNAKYALVL